MHSPFSDWAILETFVFVDPTILSALFCPTSVMVSRRKWVYFHRLGTHFRFRVWSPKRLPQRTSPKCAGSRPGEKPRPYPSPAQCWAPKPPPHLRDPAHDFQMSSGMSGNRVQGMWAERGRGNIHILIAPSRPSSMCSRTVWRWIFLRPFSVSCSNHGKMLSTFPPKGLDLIRLVLWGIKDSRKRCQVCVRNFLALFDLSILGSQCCPLCPKCFFDIFRLVLWVIEGGKMPPICLKRMLALLDFWVWGSQCCPLCPKCFLIFFDLHFGGIRKGKCCQVSKNVASLYMYMFIFFGGGARNAVYFAPHVFWFYSTCALVGVKESGIRCQFFLKKLALLDLSILGSQCCPFCPKYFWYYLTCTLGDKRRGERS